MQKYFQVGICHPELRNLAYELQHKYFSVKGKIIMGPWLEGRINQFRDLISGAFKNYRNFREEQQTWLRKTILEILPDPRQPGTFFLFLIFAEADLNQSNDFMFVI